MAAKTLGGWFSRAALAGALLGAAILALTLLPARSSQFAYVDISELVRAPRADGFTVGPLEWDLAGYAVDPKLEPFRAFFRERCRGQVGLRAAQCVSQVFASAFPEGAPSHEFFQADYDPAGDFAAHMRGEPGHCVTRSGLITAILLASSVPARQVQVSATTTAGHNLLEVWDGQLGWVVVDPTFGRMLVSKHHPQSIAKIVEPDSEWVTATPAPPHDASPADDIFYADLDERRKGGDIPIISLPEPWLYMRSGHRHASWPFRGLFVQTGGRNLFLGPAQTVLRALIVLLGLIGVACAGQGWRGRRRDQSARVVAAGRTNETSA